MCTFFEVLPHLRFLLIFTITYGLDRAIRDERGLERLCDLSKITHLISGRSKSSM